MSVLPPFAFQQPRTLDAALACISEEDLPLVGGTELLLAMRQGLLRPRSLVDLKRVEGLGEISLAPDRLTVGGTVTHHQLAVHHDSAAVLPILGEVLRSVGNPRVQAAGTPAGNLCFAEPKSDVIPLLISLGADLTLASANGQRTVTVESFIVGPYSTLREPSELLISISIPLIPERTAAYVKYQTMERPTVGVAAARIGDYTRVVVGAAGMSPVVVESNGAIDPTAVADLVEVIPDLTGSVDYKRHMTSVFVGRAMAALEEKS